MITYDDDNVGNHGHNDAMWTGGVGRSEIRFQKIPKITKAPEGTDKMYQLCQLMANFPQMTLDRSQSLF